jgi:sarcosine oxidase, subunit gamma
MSYAGMSRTSPVEALLPPGDRQLINQMTTLTSVPGQTELPLKLIDLSCLPRFGVKGAGAANWLISQGITPPGQPNRWVAVQDGIVARLGISEFLIETGFDSVFAMPQQTLLPQVYPILRQDLAIALWGELVYDLLAQICNVNFRSLPPHTVVLTSMIGVSVTILFEQRAGLPFYRLWCDGTYGEYVWRTLLEIIQELNGGVAGIEALRPSGTLSASPLKETL